MDIIPNHHRIKRPGSTHEELPVHISNGASSSTPNARKRWCSLMPLVVVLVLIAEMGFLGRLDMTKNAAMLADSLYQLTTSFSSAGDVGIEEVRSGVVGLDRNSEAGGCEEWLMREDSVVYSRDFEKEPVLVSGDQVDFNKKPDAMFGVAQQPGTANVLRSMESSLYYPQNNIDRARRKGYNIVMTTSLSSDVPVGYFSWVEYDIMAPPQAKTEKALAAAFISNCGGNNFRLQALEALEKANISIDSYGSCHRNRDGTVDKVETLKRYKFSLAFENSNEEDYVTEKFFQSLLSGCVPVVIGAPNILDFAPSPDSILHIRELEDVESVAKTMKYLAENSVAYNQSVRWKFEGPSDSFKALVDMAAVHSSCRLCIYLATMIREKEEQTLAFWKRPCKCTRGLETVYHVYVRERGRFEMESIFLRSSDMTLEALESAVLSKLKALKHVPIWKLERPKSIRGGNELKIYRIYPIGKTQREALYTFRFGGNAEFGSHIERNPCPKFEVIFV